MQGQLKQKVLEVEIETVCKHCHHPMRIRLDSNLKVTPSEGASEHLVFMPDVDFEHFTGENIIDAY